MEVDFNPNYDFAKFRTFAFIGGVEQLVRMQLNPDQLSNRIYRAATRELWCMFASVKNPYRPRQDWVAMRRVSLPGLADGPG